MDGEFRRVLTVDNSNAMVREAAAIAPGCMDRETAQALTEALEGRTTLDVITPDGSGLARFILRFRGIEVPATTLVVEVDDGPKEIQGSGGVLYKSTGIIPLGESAQAEAGVQ